MNNPTFNNSSSQAERKQLLRNDRLVNTLQGRAVAELLLEASGRHSRPADVTAAEAIPVSYPAADWTRAQVGDEMPFGVDISAVDPVGEPHELELEDRRDADAASSPSSSLAPLARGESADAISVDTRSTGATTPYVPQGGEPRSSQPRRLLRRPVR